MKFDLIQMVSDLSASYELREESRLLGTAYLKNNFLHGGTCACTFFDEPYAIVYSPAQQAKSWIKPRLEKTNIPYQIQQQGEPVGWIYMKISGGNIFQRFEYYFMERNGREYAMYAIGFGQEGMKYPIYEEDTQVGLIEKDTVVRSHLDVYHILACDENAGLTASLFGIYLDMHEFASRGRIDRISYEKNVVYTTKKALKEKYNPAFKDRM